MKTRHRFAVLGILAVLAIAPAQAQVLINSSVTAQPGTFNYQYQIVNQGRIDYSVITIGGILPFVDAVQNLFSPPGFFAFFDSNLGLLSFLEDTQPFLAGSSSGTFSFDSPYAPGPGFYEAVDVNGGLFAGTTIAPAFANTPTPVPEPATYAVFGAVFLLGLIIRRKFSSATSAEKS